MMDVVLVINGLVDTVYRNAVLTDFAERDGDYVEAPSGEVFAGFAFDGTTFEAPPSAPSVPSVVSMRQARLALLASSLLEAVDTAIAQGDSAAAIEWEYATELRRDHPLVAQLGQALELSEAEIDNLFITASQL